MKITIKELRNTIGEVIQEIGRYGEPRTKKGLASQKDPAGRRAPQPMPRYVGVLDDYIKKIWRRNEFPMALREMFRATFANLAKGDEEKALRYLNRAKFSVASHKFPEVFEDLKKAVEELADDMGVPIPPDYE